MENATDNNIHISKRGDFKVAYNKDSQKKYNEKRIQYNISWKTKEDITDGKRLQTYLSQSGQTANRYIKALIKRDLDEKGIEA